ncbi:hypothetical protein [uncultured Alistipes sp.]|uniref:hypothetical protein n=1 Tax=uncultured Alistipes sp. TaxID=538949 RepID=UPI0025932B15|nr:hypothetical protein [uncultured Alistipes sp.]
MIRKLTYNNRILSEQERAEFCRVSDEYIKMFSESIDGIYRLAKEDSSSNNSDYKKITDTVINISIFTGYSFCDCIVLMKLFVRATNPYEKSMLRGKLKVQLNEGFKKLYGFTQKGYKDSYCAQLENIMPMFPGFRNKFNELSSDLALISKDSWWKDERNAEVHINAGRLYELRHEEINESKVAMETMQLIDLFNRFNHLVNNMHRALLNHMIARYVKENGIYPIL